MLLIPGATYLENVGVLFNIYQGFAPSLQSVFALCTVQLCIAHNNSFWFLISSILWSWTVCSIRSAFISGQLFLVVLIIKFLWKSAWSLITQALRFGKQLGQTFDILPFKSDLPLELSLYPDYLNCSVICLYNTYPSTEVCFLGLKALSHQKVTLA